MSGISSSSHSHHSYSSRSHEEEDNKQSPAPFSQTRSAINSSIENYGRDELDRTSRRDFSANVSSRSATQTSGLVARNQQSLSARISPLIKTTSVPGSSPALQSSEKAISEKTSKFLTTTDEERKAKLSLERRATIEAAGRRSEEALQRSKALQAAKRKRDSDSDSISEQRPLKAAAHSASKDTTTLASRLYTQTAESSKSRPREHQQVLSEKTLSIQPLPTGTRPVGFIKRWVSDKKLKECAAKHVVDQKEFTHSSLEDYKREALTFWDKPIHTEGNQPNILEKIGKNGRLYRFEPSTGLLGVAALSRQSGEPEQITFFRVEFFKNNQINPNYLEDGLRYYHRQ